MRDKQLDDLIRTKLLEKPNIEHQYIVKDIQPWPTFGYYMGEDKEGSTKLFHDFRPICETWFEAICYNLQLEEAENENINYGSD